MEGRREQEAKLKGSRPGVRGYLGSRRDGQNAEVHGQAHTLQMGSNSWTLHQADEPELLIVEDRGARRNYGADRN